MPRVHIAAADGSTKEWRSTVLPRYARMTRQIEALITGAYLAGTNTHRVKRALAALFGGAVGKGVVSRTLRPRCGRLLRRRIAEQAMAEGANRLGCLEQARPG